MLKRNEFIIACSKSLGFQLIVYYEWKAYIGCAMINLTLLFYLYRHTVNKLSQDKPLSDKRDIVSVRFISQE